MIKSVTVTNFLNESIRLELSNPYENGIAIQDISGIGPAKANINTTELAVSDGSIFNSARVTSRNIVFDLMLLPDPDTKLVEDTRQRTYKYFPLKKMLTLTFETDNRVAEIQGYVESNEPDIFQQEETAQISIVCPSPYFYSNDQMIVLNGVESQFYFPFSNESLTEELLYFGEIIESVSLGYDYEGDVDSGMIFHIHTIGEVHNVSLYNAVTRERMDINTGIIGSITKDGENHLIAGDDVYLSTVSGDRYIYLVRSGKQYNILPAIPKMTDYSTNAHADWIRMVKGSNVFGYLAEYGKSNATIEIYTNILYEGV